MLKFRALLHSSSNAVEPTTIEVYPNRAEFVLHRRRERFHDYNITIKSCADELDAIRWRKMSVITYNGQVNGRTGIIAACGKCAF